MPFQPCHKNAIHDNCFDVVQIEQKDFYTYLRILEINEYNKTQV